MGLVTTTEMFKRLMKAAYVIGAFNVNNMELIQNCRSGRRAKCSLILQVSAGARK